MFDISLTEWVGYLASLVLMISFLMKNIKLLTLGFVSAATAIAIFFSSELFASSKEQKQIAKASQNIQLTEDTSASRLEALAKFTKVLSIVEQYNVDNVTIEGKILLHDDNIYDKSVNVAALRRRVGMVFQKPNPFPKSIFENVTYGLRIQGINDKRILEETVETSLRGAALWDEVKDRLNDNALGLSGGQQQRLVIARAIAIAPEVLLLDEPASALDPISTLKIEELINELKEKYTIVIVTHNMQQAARVSDYTAFMYMGDLIEIGATTQIFTKPAKKQTEDYITGRYG